MDNLELSIIADNTQSMANVLGAVRESMDETSTMVNLLFGKPSVEFGVVGDFHSMYPDAKQGGVAFLPADVTEEKKRLFIQKYMNPGGSQSWYEAYRTLMNLMLQRALIDPKSKFGCKERLVFLLLDAEPHGYGGAELMPEGIVEKQYIEYNKMIWDWEELGVQVKAAGLRVVTFIIDTGNGDASPACWKSVGQIVMVKRNDKISITRAMMWTLNQLFGIKQADADLSVFTPPRDMKAIVKTDMMKIMKTATPEYVLTTFDKLFSNPDGIMCLTTNDILGKYWRMLCGKIKYGYEMKYKAKCDALAEKMSSAVRHLSPENKARFKIWQDASHDSTYEIAEIIKAGFKTKPEKKSKSELTPELRSELTISCLELPEDMRGQITLDEILQIGYTGKMMELSKFICSLKVRDYKISDFVLDEDAPEFKIPAIPVSLKSHDLFRLIGHLIKPGFMFSSFQTYMIAILGLKNQFLAEVSQKILEQNVGKWIKWDLDATGAQLFPMFWPIDFIKLLRMLPDSMLTEKEIEFRDIYFDTWTINRNLNLTVPVRTALQFSGTRQYKTWKRLCEGCHQFRCMTIFPGDRNRCGLCISEYYEPDSRGGSSDSGYWVQCRTCTVNYTVVCVGALNVEPKCYYCRERGYGSPFVECGMCLGKFANPGGSVEIEAKRVRKRLEDAKDPKTGLFRAGFVCPRCIHDASGMVVDHDIKIRTLFDQNPILAGFSPLQPFSALVAPNIALWKRALNLKRPLTQVSVPKDSKKIYLNHFRILDSTGVIENVMKTLVDHSGIEICPMCIEETSAFNMIPACGNCKNRICRTCSESWYSQVKIGHMVSEGNCRCPFCKTIPKYAIISKLELRFVRGLRITKACKVVCDWDPKYVFGICKECTFIKPMIERDCAAGTEALQKMKFKCSDCSRALEDAKSTTELGYKLCPNPDCKIPTDKSGGCNHITCGSCGIHWCWTCERLAFDNGTEFDSHNIYDHMMDECGGIGL